MVGRTVSPTATSVSFGELPVLERIESLDVLRGVALLGILLLNIVGFGLPAAAYFNPELGIGTAPISRPLNLTVWALVDVCFEGAMRALFSLLFGASVLLFTTGRAAKSAALHYRRNFWLLMFGLFNAFVLLWIGDVLLTYALVGFCLYPLRHASAGRLFTGAAGLLLLLTVFSLMAGSGVAAMRSAAEAVADEPGVATAAERELAAGWHEFAADNQPDAAAVAAELAERSSSYGSAFAFTVRTMQDVLLFQLPLIMFWDAAAMMLLGMALYRWGLLDGGRSTRVYLALIAGGFGCGLTINGWELKAVIESDFDLLQAHGYLRWSYHLGRCAMALGYLGLVMLLCRSKWLPKLRGYLAAVGRMALSNYLLHSLIGLLLFTGAGLGLVGVFERWQLYPLVLLIWLVQLTLSRWWLDHFYYGPLEWFWRGLSYGRWPQLRR